MSKNYFLISASGKDRPGIVAAVTKVLFELGGNVEDSTMTRLGGEFTIMLIVSVPSSLSLPTLQKGLHPLGKKLALHVSVQPMSAGLARGTRSEPHYLISIYGTDQAGIIYQVAKALADRRINITDLQTKSITRGHAPLYVMLLEVQTPTALDVDELRNELERLRQSLQVELTLQDIEAIAL
ncbi:MAG: ACT domain-containing protein [Elusimicrobiota bacterium]|jgi:glycine cleavage system transcriptional repressor